MARPSVTTSTIDTQVTNWDQIIDANFGTYRAALFTGPFVMTTVHLTTPSEGSVALSTFPAADYAFCTLMCVDPATVATNGNLIYSDGTNWKYQRSGSNV